MKLIIAGGRDYQLSRDDHSALNDLASDQAVTEIIHGGAPGADRGGKLWAEQQQRQGMPKLIITEFKADWKTHGKAAGPIRNKQMAEYADAVVLFPGGRGTDSMFREAGKTSLVIFDWRKETR